MVWVVLLVVLTASVCGTFAENMTSTKYQVEEDNTVTISWDSHNQTDLSQANMICFLQSKPKKVFYQMFGGAEVPESQHQQFAGRVVCERDGLRRGRVQLHVFRVSAEDSGDYRCDVVANYDGKEGTWRLKITGKLMEQDMRSVCVDVSPPPRQQRHESNHLLMSPTETFALNVSQRGANSDMSLTTPKLPEREPGGSKLKLIGYLMVAVGVVALAAVVLSLSAAFAVCVFQRRHSAQLSRAQDRNGQAANELLIQVNQLFVHSNVTQVLDGSGPQDLDLEPP